MRTKPLYEFGPFRLDAAERLLLRDGEVVPLTLKVFDTLVLLVENSGHLLEREQLLRAVWADSFVEEANLTVSISALRKALGEQAGGKQYIETVPKRGYRFVADVSVDWDEREDLILHERTRAQVIIELEEETEDQGETRTEIDDPARVHAKARINRRVKLRALIAGVALVLMIGGAAYWRKTIRAKQTQADAQIRSIAVLPFMQLGEGEKDELVGFGMADVLITRIGSLNRIAVRPTSAVFKYIGTEPDIVSVGRELKVDAVLEGSIQRIGDRTRVTLRLMRARDGELLWASTFDGRPYEPFELQDRMSERVAAALSLTPVDEQKALLTKRYTNNPQAYQAYMKGLYFRNKRSSDGLRKSIEYCKQAIAIDPTYAPAFAGLADGYSLLANYHQVPEKEGFPKAKEAANKALSIDNTLAEAHASLAKVHHLYDWDWEAAETEFKHAIELNADYATAHQWYGEYLTSMGRFDEAKAEMTLALELDPVSIPISVAQGFPYYYNHEYDEAIAAYKKALELDSPPELARFRLNQVYIQQGMYEEAIAEDVANYADSPKVQESIKALYATSGIRGRWEADVVASEKASKRCCRAYLAWFCVYLGDKDNALKFLEIGYQERSHMMVNLKVDPAFDDLRSDPRFQELLRRMRLEP